MRAALVTFTVILALVDAACGFVASIPPRSQCTNHCGLRASLTFSAQINATSDPIEGDNVVEFFTSPEFLQTFCFKDGESGQVLPLSDDHWQLWHDICHNEAYGYGPELAPPPLSTDASTNARKADANKCVVVLNSAQSQYPGLTVVNSLTSGIQLYPAEGTLPLRYKLVLLSDSRTAIGARFAVWLFNQLTNPKNSTDSETGESAALPSCRAVTTISLSPSNDGVAAGYCIRVQGNVSVTMQVPRLLVKVLPMSLERAEAVGSESIQTTVAADTALALERTLAAVRGSHEAVLVER